MKNPMHHLRNLAIYENSVSQLFNNQNEENMPLGQHAQFVCLKIKFSLIYIKLKCSIIKASKFELYAE
jgi:hypothetical protein